MKLVEFLNEVVKIADHKNYPKEIFVTDGDHKPLRVIGISMVNNRITILADSTRDTKTIHCAQCNFWLNPEKHDFYSFTRDDVRLDNYETGEQIKDIPVAI